MAPGNASSGERPLSAVFVDCTDGAGKADVGSVAPDGTGLSPCGESGDVGTPVVARGGDGPGDDWNNHQAPPPITASKATATPPPIIRILVLGGGGSAGVARCKDAGGAAAPR